MSYQYMPLYTGDYLRDTRALTITQHGAYLLLLIECWNRRGPLPLDRGEIYRIAGAFDEIERRAVDFVLDRFFTAMEDGHYNARMQEEVEKAGVLSRQRSEAGAKGAAVRAAKAEARQGESRADAHAEQLPSKSLASAKQMLLHHTIPIPTPTPTPTPDHNTFPPAPFGPGGEDLDSGIGTTLKAEPPSSKRERAKPESAATWAAYAEAYRGRYGVDPVRNATVNAQLTALIRRLGHEEAPQVAAFYLRHNGAFYVRAKHPPSLLLRDAEGLRTEWATGRQITDAKAREADRIQAQGEVWGTLIAEAEKAKEGGR